MMIEQEIDSKLRKLPIYLKREVLHYIEFLTRKNSPKTLKGKGKPGFKFDWEGGLEDIKDKITSVELQHKAID